MSPVVYLVFFFYLVCVLLIGWWTSRISSTQVEYFAAGRRMPFWVVGSAYVATYMSAASFLGIVGSIYDGGYYHNASYVGSVIGYMLGLAFFGPILRRFGQFTIPDFLGARYDSDIVRGFSAVLIFVGFFLYISVQIIGVGILFVLLFGMPYWAGVSIALAVVLAYTLLGGMLATAYVDVFQMIFMWMSAIIIVTVGVIKGGGMFEIVEAIRRQAPQFLTIEGDFGSVWPFISLLLVWIFGALARADTISRAYMAKSEREVYKAIIFTTPFIWMSASIFLFFGLIGKVAIPDLVGTEAENIFLIMASDWVPPVVTGMAFAGLLATAQSTVSGQMITSSMAVGRDIYGKILVPLLKNREANEDEMLKVTKYAMFFMASISLIFAIIRPGWILDIVSISMAIMGPAFLVTWGGGYLWKKATKIGAIAALILGGVGGTYTSFADVSIPNAPWLVEPLLVVILSALGLIIGSMFGKPSENALKTFWKIRGQESNADVEYEKLNA